jgi:hypothetical protein
MAVTINQIESEPAEYPDAPEGLSTAAAALTPAVVWERIESFVAHRWASRAVTWIVEGPGEWVPPLTLATVSKVEIWSSAGEWEDCTPPASPLGGYWLSASGPFRFTATVGGAEVPATVSEAYRRLAEYMAAKPGEAGATSERFSVEDIESRQIDRSAAWMARALQNSGAADLLRGYRHV